MSVQQISVFLESRPGHLRRVLDAFEDAHVSVRGYSASDTGDYGIVRFIVDAPDKALAVLQDMGAAATQTDVLCARLDDVPGELARVMGIMADCGINVTYSYSLISTYIALSVKDIARAEKLLAAQPRRAHRAGRPRPPRRAGKPVIRVTDITVKGAALAAVAAGDFSSLPIHNPAVECASRERIRAIQLEKLVAQVRWTYERVPWYRARMDDSGVTPSDIKTLEDVRMLPFTDKSVLRDTFPYGLFAVPLDEVVELHSSSGTTGKPIVVGYNESDMAMWADCIMRLVQMAGVVPGDRAQMAFGYGMFTGGFGLHYGLQKLGCMMIPAGSGNTERHIAMIEDYGTTVLVATPSYALHVCEVGEKMGYDWEKSPLRVGLFGGEPCPPGLKAEIESRMHIVCTDNYGLTEVMGPGVSGECLASRDMQHIAEDHFLWEVVDPETGEPVPDGEMGELVLTPLGKQAIPVLRYRTHDLTRVVTEPCACGRTTARMQKVRARSDDMLIIRGTNVFPSQVEDVLAGIDGVTPHYRIVVENAGGLDRMTVHVELKPEAFSDSYEDMENLRRSIEDKLKGVLLVGVKAKLVEPGGIERSTGKTKHVEDLRK